MGNNAQKLSPEDVTALNGMETTTGLDRKELIKEYKKFKKHFPNGAISRDEFHQVRVKAAMREMILTLV